MALHKPDAETNKLASRKRSKADYIRENNGILGTVFGVDDADSPFRIEGLNASTHRGPCFFIIALCSVYPYSAAEASSPAPQRAERIFALGLRFGLISI